MAIVKKVKRCQHCGAILQSNDKEENGYISENILKKYPDGLLLCDKCFNEEKNEQNLVTLSDDFKFVLNTIKKEKPLIVYVIDLFSFEGCFPSEITNSLSGLDILVVGNKIDLMPKSVDNENLKKYVEHRLRVANFEVKDVILTSTSKHFNIDLLNERINEFSNKRNVYFIGSQTSGKSSLMTDLLKIFKNPTNEPIVTCNFEGTNLRGFKIPLHNRKYMYEIPGFPLTNSMSGVLDKPISNYIVPKKSITNRKVSISNKIAVAFSGICFIQEFSEKKTILNCYLGEKIDIKYKRTTKPEDFFNNLLMNGSQFNTCYKFRDLSSFSVYDIDIDETGDRDIGILGLGWFSFKGDGQKFRIYVPKGVFVYTTRAKIKYVK